MKDKKVVDISVPPVPAPVAVPTAPPAPAAPPPKERISDVDKLSLDLAGAKRATALAEAKTALANHENSELQFKYLVLKLYMDYKLTAADALSENGEIIRNGAVGKVS